MYITQQYNIYYEWLITFANESSETLKLKHSSLWQEIKIKGIVTFIYTVQNANRYNHEFGRSSFKGASDFGVTILLLLKSK